MTDVVITIGMFDGVHLGHRQILNKLLREAALRSLRPVVVTFDRHPRQVIFGQQAVQLLNTCDERLAQLHAFEGVETVVLSFDNDMACMSACNFFNDLLLSRYNVRALLLGYDNTFGNKAVNDFDKLRSDLPRRGIEVIDDEPVFCNGIAVSSTKIRQALSCGDVRQANTMLGYSYSYEGVVRKGRQIGRTIGYPTANIDTAEVGKMLPADGVYEVMSEVDGVTYKAVANLGSQPTVEGVDRMLEVHLIGYDGNLYGRRMRVAFVRRLRDVRHFDDLKQLGEQIREDIKSIEQ